MFLALALGAFEASHVYVIYEDALQRRAYRLAEVYDSIYEHVANLTGYFPGKPVVYVISTGASPNGFAVPYINRDVLFFSTPGFGMRRLLNFYWWDYLLASHELTHLAHLRNISGVPYALGLILALNPYLFSPAMTDFLVESTTVYAESSFSPYQGRLNNPLATRGLIVPFVKRAIEAGGGFPSDFDIEMYPPNRYPGYGSIYLIPSQFYEFLIDRYGLEKVKKFHRLMGRNWKFFFGVNGVYKKAFGEDRRTLWRRWEAYLYKKYANETVPGKELVSLNGEIIALFAHKEKLYGVISLFTDTGSFSAEPYCYLVEFVPVSDSSDKSSWNYRILKGLGISFEDLPKMRGDRLYFLAFDVEPGGLYSGTTYPVRYKTVLWSYSFSSGEVKKLASSPSAREYISAFERLYGEDGFLVSYFDEASEKSRIFVMEKSETESDDAKLKEVTSFEGKVISIQRSQGGYFVIVQPPLSSQKIYFIKRNSSGVYEVSLVDESPYFKYGFTGTEKGLLFTACTDGEHMDVYLMDHNRTLWKLTDGAYASVAILDEGEISASARNPELYYVGFSLKSYGKALWKAKPLWEKSKFKNQSPDVPGFPKNEVRRVSWIPHRFSDVFVPKIVTPTVGYDPVEGEWGAGTAFISTDPLSMTSYSLMGLYMFRSRGVYLNFSAQNYLPWVPLRFYAGLKGAFYPSKSSSGNVYAGSSFLLYHAYVPVEGGFSLSVSPSLEFDHSFDEGRSWFSLAITASKGDFPLSLPSAGWWDYRFRLASALSYGPSGKGLLEEPSVGTFVIDNITFEGYIMRGFRGFLRGSTVLYSTGSLNVPDGIFMNTFTFSSPVLLGVVDYGLSSARFYLYSIYASPFASLTVSDDGALSLDDWKVGAYFSFRFSWLIPRLVLFMSIGGCYGKNGPDVIFNVGNAPYVMGMFFRRLLFN